MRLRLNRKSGLTDSGTVTSDAGRSVARVDHQRRIIHDPLIIVSSVICDDDDAILLPESLFRQRL